jgi:hypothetical protein
MQFTSILLLAALVAGACLISSTEAYPESRSAKSYDLVGAASSHNRLHQNVLSKKELDQENGKRTKYLLEKALESNTEHLPTIKEFEETWKQLSSDYREQKAYSRRVMGLIRYFNDVKAVSDSGTISDTYQKINQKILDKDASRQKYRENMNSRIKGQQEQVKLKKGSDEKRKRFYTDQSAQEEDHLKPMERTRMLNSDKDTSDLFGSVGYVGV